MQKIFFIYFPESYTQIKLKTALTSSARMECISKTVSKFTLSLEFFVFLCLTSTNAVSAHFSLHSPNHLTVKSCTLQRHHRVPQTAIDRLTEIQSTECCISMMIVSPEMSHERFLGASCSDDCKGHFP